METKDLGISLEHEIDTYEQKGKQSRLCLGEKIGGAAVAGFGLKNQLKQTVRPEKKPGLAPLKRVTRKGTKKKGGDLRI